MTAIDMNFTNENAKKSISFEKIMEWAQTFTGVIAALLIASNLGSTYVLIAMCLFMVKDIIMIAWSKVTGFKGLFVNSICFFLIDL